MPLRLIKLHSMVDVYDIFVLACRLLQYVNCYLLFEETYILPGCSRVLGSIGSQLSFAFTTEKCRPTDVCVKIKIARRESNNTAMRTVLV